MKRLYSHRKAKTHWVYDDHDICVLYNVSRNTPRNWVRQGLKVVVGQGQRLVRGQELNHFHRQRWLRAKATLRPEEMYCLGCRLPRRPFDGSVIFRARARGAGIAHGICPECAKAMCRLVGPRGLELMRTIITVNINPDKHD